MLHKQNSGWIGSCLSFASGERVITMASLFPGSFRGKLMNLENLRTPSLAGMPPRKAVCIHNLKTLPCPPAWLDLLPALGSPHPTQGFPCGSAVENPPANAGDVGSIPRLGRYPGEGNGNALQYACLGNPTDRGACRLWSTGSLQRVGHVLVTNSSKGYPELPAVRSLLIHSSSSGMLSISICERRLVILLDLLEDPHH